MLPSDGGLVEPRPAEFDGFYHNLTVGDERGVSSVTAAGLHFPAVQYFALFIAECLLAREKVGPLSAPNFAVLLVHSTVTTLIAWELLWPVPFTLISPRVKYMVVLTLLVWQLALTFRYACLHDYSLPKFYLDHAAMQHHQFIASDYPNIPIPYNLVFSENTRDIIPLHAPALFDPIARGGYRIMPANIIAYRNNQAAAEEEPQQWDLPAPQPFDMGPHGFFDY